MSPKAETMSWNFTGSAARSYDRRTGGVTRFIAAHTVTLIPSLPQGSRVLDNACGPGVLTDELLKVLPNIYVNAVDISPDMVDVVRGLIDEKGWGGHVETEAMDGQELKFQDDLFDASFTIFGIFLFPDGLKGAREIYRTLKPGGTAMVTTWKSVAGMSLLHEVQEIVRPGDTPLTMPIAMEWFQQEKLVELLKEAGFGAVKISEKAGGCWAASLDDMVSMQMETLGPMMEKRWDEKEMKEMGGALKKVLLEQKKRFIIDGDHGKVGLKGFVAWIAMATK